MTAQFVVNSGKVACASAAAKVMVQIASTATKTCRITSVDVSFDGTDATKTPILCELVRETGVSSTGGTAPTPALEGGDASVTTSMTARINDTTDGASPTVLRGWLVSPTSGFSYQWPMGREPSLKISDFVAWRCTTVAGSGTPNYDATVGFEE